MLLNIALILHILLVLIGLLANMYEFIKLPSYLQEKAELKFTWFGKLGFISLLILLYRIGG